MAIRAAIIEEGLVVNVVMLDDLDEWPGAVEAGSANIGDAWDGEVFTPPEVDPSPITVPQSVTMRQARLALLGAGLLDAIQGAIDAMEGPQGQAARIEWEYSQEVQRNKALVLALTPMLGMTDEQIDSLFIAASQID